ncbi:hypothetical protein [Mesorhizobium sp. CO1-1-4]|uniref:hypothetical protein n=1 Tax=Mesorhizobium sp. CO1-1-4 TaxID=2876633 RepID=UPI001CCC765D|nr:hypothetical protein [Mesorhizobium sp. CO1-1-4]MBZ9737973.1 hypothetical protein [Mesorhizobium sp. CO1-1-4]
MNVSLASDLSGAAAALAGLILVFLGATVAAYDGYNATQQGTVVARYRRRAAFAFFGFVLSLLSAGLALAGQWLAVGGWLIASAIASAISVILVATAAWQAYSDVS